MKVKKLSELSFEEIVELIENNDDLDSYLFDKAQDYAMSLCDDYVRQMGKSIRYEYGYGSKPWIEAKEGNSGDYSSFLDSLYKLQNSMPILNVKYDNILDECIELNNNLFYGDYEYNENDWDRKYEELQDGIAELEGGFADSLEAMLDDAFSEKFQAEMFIEDEFVSDKFLEDRFGTTDWDLIFVDENYELIEDVDYI